MLYKNFFEELAFKFSDLSNLKPSGVKTRFNLFDNLISDDFVYNINPSRYAFYMEFMRALKDPELLKSIIYENKLIKNSRESEAEIIDKIVNRMNRLYTDENLIKLNENDYRKEKKAKIDRENAKLKKRLEKILDTYEISDKTNANNAINKIFDGGEMVGGLTVQDISYGNNGGFLQNTQNQEPYIYSEIDPMQQQQFSQTQEVLPFVQQSQEQKKEPEKPKTPEKRAFDLIRDEIKKIDERLTKKDVTDADVDVLNIFIKDLENLRETYKERAKKGKIEHNKENDKDAYDKELEEEPEKIYNNNPEYIDTSESEMNTEISKLKSLKKRVIEETKKVAKSTRQVLENEINEKRKEIKTKEVSNEKAEENSNERAKDIKKNYEVNPDSLLHLFKGKLKTINEGDDPSDIKASKLKDVIDDIENNEFTTIEQLKISKSDRLVFIGVTFLVRLICLVLIDWALNTNYVVSFTQAYVLYVALYCIFIMLIVVIVNMTYNYPLNKLYNGDHGIFSAIASSMYYFYLIPGNIIWESARFIVHFTLIIFLTVIAIMIKSNETTEDNVLNYDYTERKNIRRALSNFTLLLWFFTSVVSMYMF